MLQAARDALNVPEGTSSQDAAARLLATHAAASHCLRDPAREEGFDIPIPRPLDWHDRHAPIVARYATPTPDPSKTKASKKGGGEKGKSRAAGK